VQADLAYGVLTGESVGCVATTSTLFWSDLSRTGPNRTKVATTAASTRPMLTASPVSFRLVSLLVGPLGMPNSMPIENNRDAWGSRRERDRRFPPPWTVEKIPGGFKIVDANGRSMASVYGHADPRDAHVAKALPLDEAGAQRPTSPSCQRYSGRAS